MTHANPIDFYKEAEKIVPNFVAVEQELAASAHKQLFHLIALRASQINQCAYCVKMHIAEAKADGEKQERLDRLIVWPHVSDYTEAEKAAFAWVEALTELQPHTDYASLRGNLFAHYTQQDVALITAKVAMINLWNRIGISNH